jgi:hypothetical protein
VSGNVITAHWREVESVHDARRELADHLVNRLSGKWSVMYEVATREIPERSLLCLKRTANYLPRERAGHLRGAHPNCDFAVPFA